MRSLKYIALIATAMLLGACASVPPGNHAGYEAGDSVQLTGSRLNQPKERMGRIPLTASPMHIVTRDDPHLRHATDTADALRHLPFVTIR